MDVHLPDFPIYQVTKVLTLGEARADKIPPGSVVNVLADPKVPDKIGIIWDPELLKTLSSRPPR